MEISLIILLLGFILIFTGYFAKENFFTLAGGFLILITGILMVSNPLTMQDGFTINETNDTITEVTPNYSETSGLYNTALNLTLIIVGMMFTWNGYIRLYEERVNKREEKYERIENE